MYVRIGVDRTETRFVLNLYSILAGNIKDKNHHWRAKEV